MRIVIIGKFHKLYDEEYIAKSFEMIGCEVIRIPQTMIGIDIILNLFKYKPDVILYAKWDCPLDVKNRIEQLQRNGTKTVCWLFDLYFGYTREFQVKNKSFFKSDYVFTTDGGHQKEFEELGINHKCVRQGIYKDDCYILPFKEIKYEIVFVGSYSPIYPERNELMQRLGVKWIGKHNSDEIRGDKLNELYCETRIVVGDSFPSPFYWSNRVVETLGRGGFLIHKETEGLKDEYPYLVTYKDEKDLLEKIDYYTKHEDDRREIIINNFNWVKDNYTCEKQCQKILDSIK